jgi:hypothetical protein
MFYQQQTQPLLWLVSQPASLGAKHYGVLVLENSFGLAEPGNAAPYVIHLNQNGIQAGWLEAMPPWALIEPIWDDLGAWARYQEVSQNPNYNLLSYNCEHFARYIATGARESKQVQNTAKALLLGLGVSLLLTANSPKRPGKRV